MNELLTLVFLVLQPFALYPEHTYPCVIRILLNVLLRRHSFSSTTDFIFAQKAFSDCPQGKLRGSPDTS